MWDPLQGIDAAALDVPRQRLGAFLDDPNGRAALLSAGLALMQPPSFGDNPTSQIGRAIGAAGESATANQLMGLKEQDADSKATLREAQAGAATARAESAGARADAAGSRLGLQRAQLEALNERNLLQNRVRLSGMYQQYVKDTAKRNQDKSLLGGSPDPVLPMNDWIAQNPMLKNMGLISPQATPSEGDETEVPAASNTTTSAAAQAPRDASQRTAGTVYQTPKGPLKWTGTGWVQP